MTKQVDSQILKDSAVIDPAKIDHYDLKNPNNSAGNQPSSNQSPSNQSPSNQSQENLERSDQKKPQLGMIDKLIAFAGLALILMAFMPMFAATAGIALPSFIPSVSLGLALGLGAPMAIYGFYKMAKNQNDQGNFNQLSSMFAPKQIIEALGKNNQKVLEGDNLPAISPNNQTSKEGQASSNEELGAGVKAQASEIAERISLKSEGAAPENSASGPSRPPLSPSRPPSGSYR